MDKIGMEALDLGPVYHGMDEQTFALVPIQLD